MSNASPRGGRWLLALALVLGGSLTLSSAPVEEKAGPKGPETPAEKLRKDLDRSVTIEIADQPLNLAINQLREQAKVNIVVDRITLNNMGIDPDQMPVNFNAKEQKLKTVLRSMLEPNNLSFAIVGENILISTDEMCLHRQMRQRVTMDFDKVELGTALKKMARQTGTNIVFDPKINKDVSTPVTIQLDEELPYDMGVKLMVELAGLKAVRVGNVFFICSKEKAAEMRQDPDFSPNPHGGPIPPGVEFPPGVIPRFNVVPGLGGQLVPGDVTPMPAGRPLDPNLPAQPPVPGAVPGAVPVPAPAPVPPERG